MASTTQTYSDAIQKIANEKNEEITVSITYRPNQAMETVIQKWDDIHELKEYKRLWVLLREAYYKINK